MELLDQLEAENPEDPGLAPKVRHTSLLLLLRVPAPECCWCCWAVLGTRQPCGRRVVRSCDAFSSSSLPPPPQELSEWACIYIRYIQILRKLETAYDQMVHPQKRLDMRKALEACIGRMLEIRHWMVKLNKGLDFVSMDDILVDLKLTPEVLEVPVPKYFVEDRGKELDDRCAAMLGPVLGPVAAAWGCRQQAG